MEERVGKRIGYYDWKSRRYEKEWIDCGFCNGNGELYCAGRIEDVRDEIEVAYRKWQVNPYEHIYTTPNKSK